VNNNPRVALNKEAADDRSEEDVGDESSVEDDASDDASE